MNCSVIYLSLIIALFAGYCKTVSLKCGACYILIKSVDTGISNIDKSKTLHTYNYRVGPSGIGNSVQTPYATSIVNIDSLLETACKETKKYREIPSLDTIFYIESNETEVESTTNKLNFACSNIIEDYEDDLVDLFKKESDFKTKFEEFCVDKIEFCSAKDSTNYIIISNFYKSRAAEALQKEDADSENETVNDTPETDKNETEIDENEEKHEL
ncbi:hypothetical protein A3Q56_02214 [Intoshia linei]|uniref:DUF3456 domain-containing protein n=1 Tax=Intoshia linei TaxID=1819745 RepID=A0A177B6X4_9BILA|nr:hypothetical protein A3Q56_02214 [Intoshia linei]